MKTIVQPSPALTVKVVEVGNCVGLEIGPAPTSLGYLRIELSQESAEELADQIMDAIASLNGFNEGFPF